jgi:hypothetical protein
MKMSTFGTYCPKTSILVHNKQIFHPPGAQDTSSGIQVANVTSRVEADDESLIDSIVSSSRQGRALEQDGYNQVASDPQVRQAIEAGNDSEARHFIREKLCNLGLMTVGVANKHNLYFPKNQLHSCCSTFKTYTRLGIPNGKHVRSMCGVF